MFATTDVRCLGLCPDVRAEYPLSDNRKEVVVKNGTDSNESAYSFHEPDRCSLREYASFGRMCGPSECEHCCLSEGAMIFDRICMLRIGRGTRFMSYVKNAPTGDCVRASVRLIILCLPDPAPVTVSVTVPSIRVTLKQLTLPSVLRVAWDPFTLLCRVLSCTRERVLSWCHWRACC